jgi:hypothetical protein
LSTYLPKSIFLAPAGTDLGVKLLTLSCLGQKKYQKIF